MENFLRSIQRTCDLNIWPNLKAFTSTQLVRTTKRVRSDDAAAATAGKKKRRRVENLSWWSESQSLLEMVQRTWQLQFLPRAVWMWCKRMFTASMRGWKKSSRIQEQVNLAWVSIHVEHPAPKSYFKRWKGGMDQISWITGGATAALIKWITR